MANRVVLSDHGHLWFAVCVSEQPTAAHCLRLFYYLVQCLADLQLPLLSVRDFPTRIRARAVGFCYSFSRLSTVFSSIIIGLILQYSGSTAVIAFIVISMLIVMLTIGIFGPNTRGIDLENI
ncbi:major facilitator transporter [Enterobacter cloacae]|uniref:Major facilitator transporter n=1 Tax=Enterobacter cloacae TaxID=550 RepID=A0A377LUX3_ENTCL|nr:major facilitator transporter [Enterobacter cloacae]